METFKAYYDGRVLIPFDAVEFNEGEVIELVRVENDARDHIDRKVAALRRLNEEIEKINRDEPLPASFFEIVSHRVPSHREVDL